MTAPDRFPDAPVVVFHVPVTASLREIIFEPKVPLLTAVPTMLNPSEFSITGVGFELKLFPLTL